MTIIVQPVTSSAPGSGVLEQAILRPNVPMHEGCPVLTKTPSVTATKGVVGVVHWTLRDRNGNPVDLTSGLDDSVDNEVRIRFQSALEDCAEIVSTTGQIRDATTGQISFEIPASVRNNAGLYWMEIGFYDALTENLLFTNKGLLSIEKGLFGDPARNTGPLTLEEIRLELRDRAIENDLLRDVEMDDVEIVNAMLFAIRQFNEAKPLSIRYTPSRFPYHDAWLKGTCARLLRTAAIWMERNKLNSSQGGINVADRDKANSYLKFADQYAQEYMLFIEQTKLALNAQSMWGVIQ